MAAYGRIQPFERLTGHYNELKVQFILSGEWSAEWHP